jgi:two-component system, NarL family, invasion response regulator UvrY
VIRVILCDDHAIVRRGLHQILTESGNIEVVAEAANYRELRNVLPRGANVVLLLDIDMPGKNGMDALAIIHKEFPNLPVLMLSLYPEDQYAVRALRSGAMGYLNKSSAPEKLIEAVTRVASGKKFISPEVSQLLADRVSERMPDAPHELLSNREFQVLRLIASGKRLSEIAEALSISPKTVSVYRARILEKLSVKNNVEVAHYVTQHRIM